MIGKNVINGLRAYCCDDCQKNVGKFKSHKAAMAGGWAISRDYSKCYCPDCAPNHRHVGRAGAKQSPPLQIQTFKGCSKQ